MVQPDASRGVRHTWPTPSTQPTHTASAMSRFASAYLPHAIYSVAITSISIHLVSQKRMFSDERARVKAQTSILESISEQLKSDKPFSTEEFERMKRLARPQEQSAADVQDKDVIGWKEVILGRKKTSDELSEWDKKDMEMGMPFLIAVLYGV